MIPDSARARREPGPCRLDRVSPIEGLTKFRASKALNRESQEPDVSASLGLCTPDRSIRPIHMLGPVAAVPYDVAFDRMVELATTMAAAQSDRNEATTRLQLIDQLLFDCLGWSRDDAELEDHESGEFADYVLDRHVRRLVVEAKREGAWFELPEGLGRISRLNALYALGGAVASALEQVESYAQRRGTPYAAICNGHQLIAFVASRQDGVSPRQGRALVFASPQELVDGFQEAWD